MSTLDQTDQPLQPHSTSSGIAATSTTRDREPNNTPSPVRQPKLKDVMYLVKVGCPPNFFAGYAPNGTIALVRQKQARTTAGNTEPVVSSPNINQPQFYAQKYVLFDQQGRKLPVFAGPK